MDPERFLAASCVDWVLGDPHRMPHPVRLIGNAISTGERWLRNSSDRKTSELVKGAVLAGAIVGGVWATTRLAVRAGGLMGEVLLGWTTLATRNLLDESGAVIDAVERGQLALARGRLAMIVGRDTESLDEAEILRAVIETVAEGLCDGVVAPIYYLALGGVPLAMAYKAVNTLDSMIGHPEPPYRYFGRVAARFDDGANFIPARLAALAIVAAAWAMRYGGRRAWKLLLRDGDLHSSPNAGQTEAAMEIREELIREHAILVRECDSFAGLERGRFLRVAVRKEEENARLVAALRNVLRGASCRQTCH
jgi:adenosylcobinamide-phosphate synthase